MDGDRFDDRTRTHEFLGRPGRVRGGPRVAPGRGGGEKTGEAPRFRQSQKPNEAHLRGASAARRWSAAASPGVPVDAGESGGDLPDDPLSGTLHPVQRQTCTVMP